MSADFSQHGASHNEPVLYSPAVICGAVWAETGLHGGGLLYVLLLQFAVCRCIVLHLNNVGSRANLVSPWPACPDFRGQLCRLVPGGCPWGGPSRSSSGAEGDERAREDLGAGRRAAERSRNCFRRKLAVQEDHSPMGTDPSQPEGVVRSLVEELARSGGTYLMRLSSVARRRGHRCCPSSECWCCF